MGNRSLSLSGFSEEADRIDHVVLPALRDAIAAFPHVQRIVLFGSRAKGDADARSDVDIAISCPSASTRTWLDICHVAEEAETLLKIDLVRLEEATPEFRQRIEQEGKVLYERRQS
jgi:predicted nucleotidyltransferase